MHVVLIASRSCTEQSLKQSVIQLINLPVNLFSNVPSAPPALLSRRSITSDCSLYQAVLLQDKAWWLWAHFTAVIWDDCFIWIPTDTQSSQRFAPAPLFKCGWNWIWTTFSSTESSVVVAPDCQFMHRQVSVETIAFSRLKHRRNYFFIVVVVGLQVVLYRCNKFVHC